MSKMNLISVASDIGSIYAGKSRAPAAFRAAGLQPKLKDAGWVISEFEALDTPKEWVASSREPNGARNEAATVDACQKVKKAVETSLYNSNPLNQAPTFQLILSGECLYCPAILSAYWNHLADSNKRVGLLYMDADCDLGVASDPNGTGNIAGMTLTHLTLRQGALESMRQFSRPDGGGVSDATNIVLFGLNIESPANQRSQLGILFDEEFRVHTSTAVQRDPMEEAKRARKWIEARVDYVIVHLDVDVINPGEFPLCNVPSNTNLGFDQAMAALKIFLSSEKTVALSLAEVNPDHDPGLKMTTRLVNTLVSCLDERRSSA